MDIFLLIKNTFAFIGIITTLVAMYELSKKVFEWRKAKKEYHRKFALLRSSDYFITHIIHVGGEFSMVYSLQVYSNEDGGYYFNPPADFVNVSFNRGGNSTIVLPSESSKKFGFMIDSVASSDHDFEKSVYTDICHLPQSSIKNEYFVKFVKKSSISEK